MSLCIKILCNVIHYIENFFFNWTLAKISLNAGLNKGWNRFREAKITKIVSDK